PRTARPGVLVVEGRLPKASIKELERRGHKLEVGDDWSEGRLSAASQDGVRRRAAANARGMQGYAAGRGASRRTTHRAVRNKRPSSRRAPMSWTPIGSPAASSRGKVTAGTPR